MLTALQEDIANHLVQMQVAEDGLQALTITTEAKGSLDATIQARVAQAGIAIVVATPSITAGDDFCEIVADVVILITENVLANQGTQGTQRSVTEIMSLIYAYLQNWQPDVEAWSPLQFQSAGPRDADEDAQIIFYTVNFQTSSLTQTLNN